MAVGTNIGNVYRSSEGFGKSAILPDNNNTFNQASVMAKSVLDKVNPKETPIDKAAILKDLKDGKAEWWIAHNAELDKDFNNLLEYGADIMAQNVDPTKSTDKASQDFQNKWAKLENAAKLSMQAKDDFEAFRAVADKEPDKYTDESLAERYAFHARPFSEMKDDYGTPPRLVSKTAPYEYTVKLQDQAKDFVATNKDWENNPEKVAQNARIAFADKSMNPGIMDALKPRIDKLTPAEKADLAQLAGTAGFSSPEEYLYAKDFESQLGEKVVPFDFDEYIKKTMPGYDINDITKETGDKTTRNRLKHIPEKKAEDRAKTALKSDPSLLPKLIKSGRATDEASAVNTLKQGYLNAADREYIGSETFDEEGYAGSGYGEDEYKQDWDFYDKAIRAEVETFEGKKLTPRQKRVLRNVAGSYVDGVDFQGGKVIDMAEGSKYKTMGKASGEITKPGELDDFSKVPILIRKKTGTKSARKGNETVSEDVYDVEEKMYTIFDNKRNDHLGAGTTKELYAGGIKQRKELFKETVRRALEEDAKLLRMEQQGVMDKVRKKQEEASGKKSTTPSTVEKLGGMNLENPNE